MGVSSDWEGFSEALADSNNANEFSDNFFINLSDHESHMVFFKERRGRLIKMAKAYWDSQTNKGLVIRIFNRVLRDRGSIELDDVARVLFQPIYEMDSDAESRIEVIECVASALIRECVEIIHKDHK